MAWAEYYRQQVAFYGQTLGQAQAHSQVRRQPAGPAPSPFPRSLGVRPATATPAPSSPRRERVWAKRGEGLAGQPLGGRRLTPGAEWHSASPAVGERAQTEDPRWAWRHGRDRGGHGP